MCACLWDILSQVSLTSVYGCHKLELNYDIIASAFTRKKEPGWERTGKQTTNKLGKSCHHFSRYAFYVAYCFHSNTWCNLLSNLFELVSKKLSVLCGFDWLYWCSKDLEIQKSNALHRTWWINLAWKLPTCNIPITTVSLDLQFASFGSCLCLRVQTSLRVQPIIRKCVAATC